MKNFEGLIVSSKFDPQEVIKKISPYLLPSSPIVIYSPYKEVLLPVYTQIRYDPAYVLTSLTESFMREYKAPVGLSGTHPEMTTSGCGGFYCMAYTVKSDGVDILPKIKRGKRDA